MRSTADHVNYLNIGLMVVSCVAAYVIPFQLFLFSYAVLGPLHYLTEISWLHDRGYFVPAKRDERARRAGRYWLALVVATVLLMLYGIVAEKIMMRAPSAVLEIALVYVVFLTAALLVSVTNRAAAVGVVALTALGMLVFSGSRYFGVIALFLITIVHVFVFTGAFVLFGALKGRSRSGILSLAVFGACALSFFVYVPDSAGIAAGAYVRLGYQSFQSLNAELIKLFGLGTGTSLNEIYASRAGLTVMRFIAFAYTYHYLNWFSKTSIIKWHDIPKRRSAAIAAVWVSAVALYGYSYQLGMIALYFLSVAHVMLEFPLNHQTFAGIGKELRALAAVRRRSARAT